MSEALVKEALKKYLKEIGAYHFMPVSMGYGAASIDFFVCYKGKFFGIETKKEGVTAPTLRQALVMSAIEASGGKCWVEASAGLGRTRALLVRT